MKILINVPYLSSPAGVSNHYLGLRPYFSRNVIYNEIFTTNFIKRKIKFSFLHLPIRLIGLVYDIFKFIILIIYNKVPTVLINPSFGYKALKRDLIFLRIAKFFGCKVVVFIHGWDKEYLRNILDNRTDFNYNWQRADLFFVLAQEFKEYLFQLGITSPICLTTTKVDNRMLEKFDSIKTKNQIIEFLFLARIEKSKGIFIAIEAFSILQKKFPNISLRIVGSGSSEIKAKSIIKNQNIFNVTFTGAQFGNNLIREYLRADIYILPTYHEGMPTTVLEAMAFGLPVITRPVGGLIDFFKNGKMGYMIDSFDSEVFANKIESFMSNPDKTRNISVFNKKYARNNFMASKVAKIFEESINNKLN